jgi:hypothetical protein
VAWWVNITPEVVQAVQSFGFKAPPPDKILEFVEHYLSLHGAACATARWDKCPDDFFVYSHVFTEAGQLHTLEFLVKDTSAVVGVLNVIWVEHYPGDPLPADAAPH